MVLPLSLLRHSTYASVNDCIIRHGYTREQNVNLQNSFISHLNQVAKISTCNCYVPPSVLSAIIVAMKAVADKCANKGNPGTLPKECAPALSILQAASFAKIQHCKAENFPRCQCWISANEAAWRIHKAWAHSFGSVPGFSLFVHLSATAFVDTMRADKTEGDA